MVRLDIRVRDDWSDELDHAILQRLEWAKDVPPLSRLEEEVTFGARFNEGREAKLYELLVEDDVPSLIIFHRTGLGRDVDHPKIALAPKVLPPQLSHFADASATECA
ncbi:hypothetical protein OICFNHDK_2819 [Methylobacterium bullatum]|uniref:Uncharacterized protein n=1 Tax=Methylobacterium bullatum TaxID=570505 RepID=A0AAV4Z8U3_9HYPH|nr:hypothetical protein OICFNHDK_2819 [Methylobacterium bullatum]